MILDVNRSSFKTIDFYQLNTKYSLLPSCWCLNESVILYSDNDTGSSILIIKTKNKIANNFCVKVLQETWKLSFSFFINRSELSFKYVWYVIFP